MVNGQRALFPELEPPDAAEPPEAPAEPRDPDLGFDTGPDRLLQRRLPAAGWVRLVEYETPTLHLPPQSVRWIVCEQCGNDTDRWTLRPSSWRASTLRVCPSCARAKRSR